MNAQQINSWVYTDHVIVNLNFVGFFELMQPREKNSN